MTAEFFDTAGDDPLRTDLITMITARDRATPRRLQRELGPSEVAHPCMRKMAYGMMEVERVNPAYDPLPSIIGTATHSWLDSAARYANHVLGRQRWLTETRVNVAPGLSGSCDLYDQDTATVIDWKVLGYTSYDKYLNDPGPVYRTQVHLYGRGFENAGLPVKRVAVAILPRLGVLSKLNVWSDEYDPQVADEALKRRNQVMLLLQDFDVDHHPERFDWFPKAPIDCIWCKWWRPEPRTPLECAGQQ